MENVKRPKEPQITIRDLWEIFIGHIWLFIISVAVSLTIAMYYIVTTPPVYMRKATILIKSDAPGNSIEGAAFDNLGLVKTNNDITNEIHVIATAQLMEEVVTRLSLHYNYKIKEKWFRWKDHYNSAPFTVVLDENLVSSHMSMELYTDGDKQYEIEKLSVNGEEIDLSSKFGTFGDEIYTPFGNFTINNKGVTTENTELYSFSKNGISNTAKRYLGALKVDFRDDVSAVIDMTMLLESPQKADDILNVLISVYNENWIKDKNIVSLSTTNFINDRLAIITKELGAVDENISSFKSENLLPDVGVAAGMDLASSNEILKRQIELSNQLSMAQYILKYIEDKSTINQLLPINSGIGSTAIDNQIAKYNELLLQKNAFLVNSSVNNPIVANMVSELDAMKSVLILSMNDLINTLTMQVDSARSEEAAAKKRLSNNPSQELYLLSTGREQMIKEQLYLFLLQKREENELSQAFTAYNTKVLSLAQGSNFPISPKRNEILFMGLIIGLLLPTLFIYIKSAFDTYVKSKKDLENINIPFIGSIPHVEAPKEEKDGDPLVQIVVDGGGRDSMNEAFRVIRTNVDFMKPLTKSDAQIIQIISLNPSSGKSFVSANIGHSMALKDSKVLLIDADIRKATLSSIVTKKTSSIGITDYVNGRVNNIDDIIIKGELHENLDILPVGIIPPNPSELLIKPKFAELIELMKGRYDYIFLDCPPVEIVPDAAIISKFCDMAIFIIRANKFDKRLLPDLEHIYKSNMYNNMCLLLNDVLYTNMGYYGYRKYGYYSYNYGYHYGTSSSKKQSVGKKLINKINKKL
ncbi:MAG: polysaccharide biosynthesis tyrosine autokinase [Rikenellaceae bacterium]